MPVACTLESEQNWDIGYPSWKTEQGLKANIEGEKNQQNIKYVQKYVIESTDYKVFLIKTWIKEISFINIYVRIQDSKHRSAQSQAN